VVSLLLAFLAAPPPTETPASREQARLCEELPGDPGLAACRRALALGLSEPRVGPVRELVARHLVSAERWEELDAHLAEDVRLYPESAAFQHRLGSNRVFALGRVEEGLASLREAVRLDPGRAEYRAVHALALSAVGRPREAAAEFEEALRLDPDVLSGRPAARAVLQAARRGENWPSREAAP
jgi:tetratricopeptide (TPR) repeat protein